MKRLSAATRRILAATALLTAGLVLVPGAAAREAPCHPLPETFDYASYDGEIHLDLNEMVSLPPQTVVLAGAFRDPGNTVHPVLLTSADGGQTWSTIPLRFHGADLGHLVADGGTSVWGIVSLGQEGAEEPLYVLRSRDAARTWCAIPLEDLDTLSGVALFRMFDHRHGLIVFSEVPFGGGHQAYHTRDGAETWVPLWRADGPPPDDVDAAADYPERAPPDPPHATLWRREADLFAARAVIRLRHDEAGYAVERYDILGDRTWRLVSRIPQAYRVVDGALAPNR